MYSNRDYQKQHISGVMISLMGQLAQLAPHPDRPGFRGALFTALPSWCHAPGPNDGMGGTILLQSLLGAAFADASSMETACHSAEDSTGGFDSSLALNALDAYETYKTETDAQRLHKAAHGQGTLARMSGTSIAKGFNQRSQMSPAMQAFLDDMPKRLRIERSLSHYLKQLNALDAAPAPHYPVPRAA